MNRNQKQIREAKQTYHFRKSAAGGGDRLRTIRALGAIIALSWLAAPLGGCAAIVGGAAGAGAGYIAGHEAGKHEADDRIDEHEAHDHD